MNNVNELYNLWLEKTKSNEKIYEELKKIEGKDDEILDRFYKNLEFGTGGLRGVIGAGTNRMNIYTVNQATQGLSDYLNANFKNPSIAIAYDSRINSDVFAKSAAEVLAANNIKVYIFPRLVPTPMLSFAVRKLKCSSGIIITASHNPAKYNGYKCYDPNGYQMTDAAAKKTLEYVEKVDIFNDVKTVDYETALENGGIELINGDVMENFYKEVFSRQINFGISKESGLKIIYTPLNGAGNIPVREMLKRAGFDDVTVVPEQENPDGNFPTCPFPNPEIRQSFECAIAMTDKIKADLLLATDPDCDRVGIAVLHNGEYVLVSGNEVGVLLTEYILSCKKVKNELPENPVILKSFVTTSLVDAVAKKYGCEVVDLLTGFKYSGEYITKLEEKNEQDRFILAMEESYGYLAGIHARDKDAVVSSVLICEMTAYYKKQNKTLIDILGEIRTEFGYYCNKNFDHQCEGVKGMENMAAMMKRLRTDIPDSIAGLKVVSFSDYESGKTKNIETGEITDITLPKSNVVAFGLKNKNGVIVRPSGTEPKIKMYLTAIDRTKESAEALAAALEKDIRSIMGI